MFRKVHRCGRSVRLPFNHLDRQVMMTGSETTATAVITSAIELIASFNASNYACMSSGAGVHGVTTLPSSNLYPAA